MDAVFIKLLNMSIAASWLILAVIILRILLKKAPKWINCILWGIAAVRLVCPFSFESILSLIPSAEIINSDIVRYPPKAAVNGGVPIINHTINPVLSRNFTPAAGAGDNHASYLCIAEIVWIIGLSCLLCYAGISFFRLRRKVSEAVLLRDNIWVADMVKSPFILGVIFPKIYLSSSTKESQIDYILAHEQAHIKRKDHWWKLIGYMLLAVYWFNPLTWAAYNLFCRDIESACDEKVVCKLDEAGRRLYSNALLSCSMQRRVIMACPLAFGEISVKERIKSVLNYKKTKFGFLLFSIAICIVVAVCFLTNPVTGSAESESGEQASIGEGNAIYKEDAIALTGGAGEQTYYSWDGGMTYTPMTDEEIKEKTLSVEWWTYDEYAEWLENEKKELQKIIGSRSWTPSTGWFTWTQEKVDETTALYEEILEQIKAGYKVSKTVDGSSDTMLMQGSSDYDEGGEASHTADIEAEITSEYYAESDEVYDYETELIDAYKSFGLSYNESRKEMYFNGKLVRYFFDGVDIDNGTATVFDFLNEDGIVDIHTVREAVQNEDGSINPIGKLISIEEYSKEEFDSRDIKAQPVIQEATAYGCGDGAGGASFEEIFAKYKDYGITYVEAEGFSGAGNVYYNGQLVNIFSDVTPDGGVFSFQSKKKSGINVRIVYNSDGEISGIETVK